MGGNRLKKEGRNDVPALNMANQFSRYKPETERAVRTVMVVEDETLKKMKAAWRAFSYDDDDFPPRASYINAVSAIGALVYSASDVDKFSLALAAFQHEEFFGRKAGLFLSALINGCKDKEVIVHTGHLTLQVYDIGYANRKNLVIEANAGWNIGTDMYDGIITVMGDAGPHAGKWMNGGQITVKGDAGRHIGKKMRGGTIIVCGDSDYGAGFGMKGGSITVMGDAGKQLGLEMNGGIIAVNGDAGQEVGAGMENGTIIVQGNAGDEVGRGMKGGTIEVGGEIGSIWGDIEHGKIFHKGKLIVDEW